MVLRIVLGALATAMAAGQLATVGHMPGILAAYGLVTGAAALTVAAPADGARPRVGVHGHPGGLVGATAQEYARARGRQPPVLREPPHAAAELSVLVQDAVTLLYAGVLLTVHVRGPPGLPPWNGGGT